MNAGQMAFFSGVGSRPKLEIQRGATIDSTGVYRYRLWRHLAPELGCVCWIALNPSTADAVLDDPTIRRCVSFARSWGYGAIEIVNLFALRATDPRALYDHADPEGPENRRALLAAAQSGQLVVAAWGAHGAFRHQGLEIAKMLARHGVALICLGTTKDGQPRHPLYVQGSVGVTRWPTPQTRCD